jgi:hypothetical protein
VEDGDVLAALHLHLGSDVGRETTEELRMHVLVGYTRHNYPREEEQMTLKHTHREPCTLVEDGDVLLCTCISR